MSSTELKKICHFLPSKYTCMAYDKESNLIAVGCETGEVAILGKKPREISFFSVHTTRSVEFLSFVVGKGLLLIVLKNDPTLYLWNVDTKSLVHSLRTKEISEELFDESDDPTPVPHVTCVTWSQHDFFYIGTDTGTVKTLIVQELASETDDTKYELVWDSDQESFIRESFKNFKDSFDGKVIVIQEKISDKATTADKPKGSEVLLLSSNGHCVLWTWSEGKPSTCKTIDDNKSLISVWWSPSGKQYTAQSDGKIAVGKTPVANCSNKDKAIIYKIKAVRFGAAINANWLIHASEYTSSTEEGVEQLRHVLSLYIAQDKDIKDFVKSLMSFGGKIIAMECLAIDGDETLVLAVLTESELAVLKIRNDVDRTNIRPRQSYRYPYLTSPVTSLQHCGKYVKTSQSEDQRAKNELIATGHCDGSVRLWLCYTVSDDSFSFMCALVVQTADYFSQLDDAMKEITLVKVTNSQKYMNVVNKCGRVLLFRLSQEQQSEKPQSQQEQEQRSEQSEKPQSQEIVLKDDKESDTVSQQASPTSSLTQPQAVTQPSSATPSKALPTPPPHFRPCQWQSRRVQLLQHFSCHYQSGPDQPLDPLTVKCVDYNGQMLWLIGTEKGLVILDVKRNELFDVIGSEKKLLKKSGLTLKHSNHSNSVSDSDCCVVCVEIIPEIQLLTQVTQTSLWVATAGRALGVFTIDDGSTDDILQKTDKGVLRHNDIVDILCCRPSESENVYVVTVTAKKFKCHVYPGDKVYKFDSENVIKSGIVSDKDGVPHLVILNSSRKLRLLKLPKLTETPYNDRQMQGTLKRGSSRVLFSSGGQHVVWCAENAVKFCYPFTITATVPGNKATTVHKKEHTPTKGTQL